MSSSRYQAATPQQSSDSHHHHHHSSSSSSSSASSSSHHHRTSNSGDHHHHHHHHQQQQQQHQHQQHHPSSSSSSSSSYRSSSNSNNNSSSSSSSSSGYRRSSSSAPLASSSTTSAPFASSASTSSARNKPQNSSSSNSSSNKRAVHGYGGFDNEGQDSFLEQTSLEIPLKENNEVLEIEFSDLPSVDSLLQILKSEKAKLHLWITLALQYYLQNDYDAFLKLLTLASEVASGPAYSDQLMDRLAVHNCLGAFFLQQARNENDSKAKDEFFQRATSQFNKADLIDVHGIVNMVGKGLLFLFKGQYEKAMQQFNYALDQSPANVPALLGKACACYNNKQYKESLQLYRRALKSNPDVPAVVRYGMGICYSRMGISEKARIAFQRVLELDPQNVDARVALATLDLNVASGTTEASEASFAIQSGMQQLKDAYQLNPSDAMVSNHLANHFFFRRDLDKAHNLALNAFYKTNVDEIKGMSSYIIARRHHANADYDQAFQYYFQATRLWPTFILAQFGLGQLYIHLGELTKACESFEKVLAVQPTNYETCKILGSLYSSSQFSKQRLRAQEFLKIACKHNPNDYEAWVELAQLQEQTNQEEALTCYETAASILTELADMKIPVELLNNIGALRLKLKKLSGARVAFEVALADLDNSISEMKENSGDISDGSLEELKRTRLIVLFNKARLLEAQRLYKDAEEIYREILGELPTYTDCYLRLGCMARDQGKTSEALEYFAQCKENSANYAEALCLIGNIRLAKHEWNLAQQSFEKVLKLSTTSVDSYPLLQLGNTYLDSYKPSNPPAQSEKQFKHALECFTRALQDDSKNVYAANGIASVLAEKGQTREANDIFVRLREVTSDVPDIWMNLALSLSEQGQYIHAVKLFENCLRKFYHNSDFNCLLHLARTHFQFKYFSECKKVLQHTFLLFPNEPIVKFNLAVCEEHSAENIFQSDKLEPDQCNSAIRSLQLAQQFYTTLAQIPKSSKNLFDASKAEQSSKRCLDLLAQSDAQMARATKNLEKRLDEESQLRSLHQALRDKKRAEEESKHQAQMEMQRKLQEAREAYRQSVQEDLSRQIIMDISTQKKKERSRKADDIIDDSEPAHAAPKKRTSRKKKRNNVDEEDEDDDDDDADEEEEEIVEEEEDEDEEMDDENDENDGVDRSKETKEERKIRKKEERKHRKKEKKEKRKLKREGKKRRHEADTNEKVDETEPLESRKATRTEGIDEYANDSSQADLDNVSESKVSELITNHQKADSELLDAQFDAKVSADATESDGKKRSKRVVDSDDE